MVAYRRKKKMQRKDVVDSGGEKTKKKNRWR